MKKFASFGILLLIQAWVSIILSFWIAAPQSFQIVFGLSLLFFIPGWVWSFFFFHEKDIGDIERIIFSIILSVGAIPLLVTLAYKIGIEVSPRNVIFLALGVISIGCIAHWIRQWYHR